jgi:glycosyltransferase involved in cell wall biosynthesis
MPLSIVFPAHNEESRIGPTLDAYSTVCTDPQTEFVVALDDCTDHTEHVVRSHALRDPRVQVRRYPKLGKGGVIMETFRKIDSDLVAFVDADCATPPSELLRLVDTVVDGDLDGAYCEPVASGSRRAAAARTRAGPTRGKCRLRARRPPGVWAAVPRHPVRREGVPA